MARYRFRTSGRLKSAKDIDLVARWLLRLAPQLPGEFLKWLSHESYEPSWWKPGLVIADALSESNHRRRLEFWDERFGPDAATKPWASDAALAETALPETAKAQQKVPPPRPGPHRAPSAELRELRERVLAAIEQDPSADQIDLVEPDESRFSLVTPTRRPRRSAFEFFDPAQEVLESDKTITMATTVLPGLGTDPSFDFRMIEDGATSAGSVAFETGDRLTASLEGVEDLEFAGQLSFDQLVISRSADAAYVVDVHGFRAPDLPMPIDLVRVKAHVGRLRKVKLSVAVNGRPDSTAFRWAALLWPLGRFLSYPWIKRAVVRSLRDLDAKLADSSEWRDLVALAKSEIA